MTPPDAALDWQTLPAHTAPYAEVIGDPISHSKSPLIHNFWIEKLGLDAHYRAAHVTPDTLAAYVAARSADPHWRGANVTIPHKVAVTELVADPGKVGQSIGAMNTLFRGEDGSIAGTNTDAAGLAVVDGLEMLVGQAAAAFAIFFGVEAPREHDDELWALLTA